LYDLVLVNNAVLNY